MVGRLFVGSQGTLYGLVTHLDSHQNPGLQAGQHCSLPCLFNRTKQLGSVTKKKRGSFFAIQTQYATLEAAHSKSLKIYKCGREMNLRFHSGLPDSACPKKPSLLHVYMVEFSRNYSCLLKCKENVPPVFATVSCVDCFCFSCFYQ